MQGNPEDNTNPFKWDKVVSNCLVSNKYTPSLTQIYKAQRDKYIAAYLVSFVDYFKPTGILEVNCCQEAL